MAETQTIIDAIRDEVMLHMMDKPLSTLTVRMMKDAIMAGWIVGRPQILITDGDEYGSIDVQLSEPNLDEVRQAVRKSLGVAPSYR